jgi:uncharacterized protein involved in exopolysaccharide biosynthesis
MTPAIGPRSGTSGVELVRQAEAAFPVNFAPLGGGDWDEDAFHRRRRSRLRWQRAAAVAGALVVTAAAIAFFSRVYEARSSVLIRPPSGGVTVPQVVGGALASEIEILRSSTVVGYAIERVGVAALYPSLAEEPAAAARSAATDRLLQDLAVRTLRGSDVIEVIFRHARSEVAADTVNRLVERFQASRGITLAPAGSSQRFLSERIEEQRAALVVAEAELAAFHTQHPATAASDPRKALDDRRAVIDSELRSLREAMDRERATGRADDPSVSRARARLDQLELEEQEVLNTHVEGSRAVAKIRHEIGLVRDYLVAKEQSATREQARRLDMLRTRQGELETELVGLGKGERGLPELERQGRELKRERDVVARRLDAYERELETAMLSSDVDQHEVALSVHVLEVARAPTITVVPAERARVAWALTGVAVATLVGAFVIDWLERRRARQAPAVWTAHVGAGGEAGSVALLLPHQQRGPGGGPVVLLLSGSETRPNRRPEPSNDGPNGA